MRLSHSDRSGVPDVPGSVVIPSSVLVQLDVIHCFRVCDKITLCAASNHDPLRGVNTVSWPWLAPFLGAT